MQEDTTPSMPDRAKGVFTDDNLTYDNARTDADILGDPNVAEQEPDETRDQVGANGLSYDGGTSGDEERDAPTTSAGVETATQPQGYLPI